MKKYTLLKNKRLQLKIYCLLVSLFISLSLFSQNVSISDKDTLPNAAAGLDVYFSNKGLLIPRVALTGTANFAPLSAHVAGMIVYNTATVLDVKPGFYYDDGSKWITGFPVGGNIGDMLFWNGSAWAMIPVGTSGQYLQLSASNIPSWVGVTITNASLTTTAITTFAATTATAGGNISADNGLTVLSRGVCYGITQNPTTANNIVIANPAGGIGSYSCNLTGLTRATTYYVRAYATNSAVTTYGLQQSFTTLALVPTLTTAAATSVTAASAISGGNVTDDGGSPISERGICFGTTTTPTILANSKVVDPLTTTGSFVSNLTGLLSGTAYYVRSYAINSLGTSYGAAISFMTLPTITSTTAATSITATSASTGGVLAPFQTLYNVYYYGVAYSTTSNAVTPTKVQTGTYPPITGLTFVQSLTGLTSSTLYYIRAYATTNGGITVYGPELSFTTSAPTAPVIASTTAITSITPSGATTGGTITTDGGAAITAKGVCWGTSSGTILGTNNFTNNGTGTANFVSLITGLTGNTTYFVRAYATNSVNTTYGPELSFITCGTPVYTIGQLVGGGKVFYVDCSGQHGLIASTVDLGTAVWGCSTVLIGTSAAYGTGSANTAAILAGCATRPNCASLASSYTGGGFTDWYLPSQAELLLLMAQGSIFGLGNAVTYASSSENGVNNVSADYWNGSTVVSSAAVKTFAIQVRAVRSF